MKKVVMIMSFLMIIFLVACQPEKQEDLRTPSILNAKDITYVMGDVVPDYQAGVTAIDVDQTDLTASIKIDDSKVDLYNSGNYLLTYSVKSLVNQNSSVVVVTVKVTEDDNYLVITGTKDIEIELNTPIEDIKFLEDVKVYDKDDNDYTYLLQVDTRELNLNKVGVYSVIYQVEYLDMSKTSTIKVTVKENNNYLVIDGTKDIEVKINTALEDIKFFEGVSAYDKYETDYTHLLQVDTSALKLNKTGIYSVTYSLEHLHMKQSATIKVTVTDTTSDKVTLSVYYLNDTHGAFLSSGSEIGLSKIANLILDEKEKNDALFIAGGDMLQGQLISNYYMGASGIHILNEMDLDAYVIGNHEFDWGLDKVLQYFNGQNTLQANFPLLGANVYQKSDNMRPNAISPYMITYKQGLRIAIIGVIGYGLESSILAPMVQDYYFSDPIEEVRAQIAYIKANEQIDTIMVVNHGADDMFNQSVSYMGVDAIFNGHTHDSYERASNQVPIIQSGNNGEMVGNIILTYDKKVKQTFLVQQLTSNNESRLQQDHEIIYQILDSYYQPIKDKYNTILTSEETYNKYNLTYYMAKLMRVKTDSDIAFHNSGGTRTGMNRNSGISEANVFRIFPFDNAIIVVELSGQVIKTFKSSYHGQYYDQNPHITQFENNTLYKVAVNDYMYHFASNPFMGGTNQVFTNIVIRDVFVEAMLKLKSLGYTTFNTNIDISFIHRNSKRSTISSAFFSFV